MLWSGSLNCKRWRNLCGLLEFTGCDRCNVRFIAKRPIQCHTDPLNSKKDYKHRRWQKFASILRNENVKGLLRFLVFFLQDFWIGWIFVGDAKAYIAPAGLMCFFTFLCSHSVKCRKKGRWWNFIVFIRFIYSKKFLRWLLHNKSRNRLSRLQMIALHDPTDIIEHHRFWMILSRNCVTFQFIVLRCAQKSPPILWKWKIQHYLSSLYSRMSVTFLGKQISNRNKSSSIVLYLFACWYFLNSLSKYDKCCIIIYHSLLRVY